MKIVIPDNIAEAFAYGKGKDHDRAAQEIQRTIGREFRCVCGHSRHWHGQEPREPEGSGACDDCACEKFERAS